MLPFRVLLLTLLITRFDLLTFRRHVLELRLHRRRRGCVVLRNEVLRRSVLLRIIRACVTPLYRQMVKSVCLMRATRRTETLTLAKLRHWKIVLGAVNYRRSRTLVNALVLTRVVLEGACSVRIL